MKETVKGLLSYAAVGGALIAGMRVASDLYDSIGNNIEKIKNKIKEKKQKKQDKKKAQ